MAISARVLLRGFCQENSAFASAAAPAQARHAAKIFLFHHEAYHNAVETFAARLEVSHRERCYIGGFRSINAMGGGLPHWVHEESFANAYAADKVKHHAFAAVRPGSRRTHLRHVAHDALRGLFDRMPPPYSDAAMILGSIKGQPKCESWEQDFEERLHQACFAPGKGRAAKELWNAFSHALQHPSLSRNGALSYVVHRSHPVVRSRAGVFDFSQREVLQRLKAECGGELIGGGRHPKWQLPDGRRIPIPGHREIAYGTVRSLLKQLGMIERFGSVENFMAGRALA